MPPTPNTRKRALYGALLALALILSASAWSTQRLPRIDTNDPSAVIRYVAELTARKSWVLQRQDANIWNEHVNRALERVTRDPTSLDAAIASLMASIGDQHSGYQTAEEARLEAERYGASPCPAPARSDSALAELITRIRPGVDTGVSSDTITPSITLIRVTHLNSPGTTNAVYQALRAITSAPHSVILDLRANPGGSIQYMTEIAGLFQSGPLWRLERRGWLSVPYGTYFARPVTDAALVILIDSGTQSAAEALAGGLRRAERAVLVGETTAGNTDLVMPHCLPTGAVLWIAEGLLQPRVGESWYEVGVAPDVIAPYPHTLAAAIQVAERLNELQSRD